MTPNEAGTKADQSAPSSSNVIVTNHSRVACNGGAGIPMRSANFFHDGTGTFPQVGDKVYKTSGPNPAIPCNQGVQADPGYYYLQNGDVMFIQSLTSDVTSILPCP